MEMILDDIQRIAVDRCNDTTQRTVAVTGPAGSGKTTIMRLVYEQLQDKGYTPVICAPTGKAAKRITEATGIVAMTIHRLLEFTHPGEVDEKTGKVAGYSYPRRTKSHKLEQTAILCDEYAMVNKDIHSCLMDAMPSGALLRVFGDANQLAPIEQRQIDKETPSPFMNLLNTFDGIRLERIHRQAEGSGIAENGKRILVGRTPTKADDFGFKITSNIVEEMFRRVIEEQKNGVLYNSLDNQIITPISKGPLGTTELNKRLQDLYMSQLDEIPASMDIPRWQEGKKLRVYVGDKVICVANNYDLNIFNGESGFVEEVNEEFGTMTVNFGYDIGIDADKVIEIPPVMIQTKPNGDTIQYDPRKSFDLGYIVTTHKAQGSEYRNVLYILSPACWKLRSRRNFYTAVTRARKFCYVISDQKSWSYALWNTQEI